MLWKREVNLEIMGYSRSFIDAIITEQQASNGELRVFIRT